MFALEVIKTKDKKGSPDRFGYEWNEYSQILPEYEKQFERWTILIPKEEWVNKAFLDVGCGMGRNSFWPMSYGAKSSVSIDVDDRSLSAAIKNLSCFKHCKVEKISAYDVPYENEFDIVFSIGVIHHLEHPAVALKKMVQAAKVKGKVMIWVYGYENSRWVVHFFNPFRKVIFSKLPISVTHFLSLFPTIGLWLFLRMGIGKISYFQLLRTFSFKHLRSIVFDQMLPQIANYWKKEEVIQLMEDAGLKNIKMKHVNDMSWCAMGEK